MFNGLATYLFALWTAITSISYAIIISIYIFFGPVHVMGKQHLAYLIGAATALVLSLTLLYISDHTNIHSIDNFFPLWNGIVIALWLASTWFLGGNKALMITAAAIAIAAALTAIYIFLT